VSSQTVSSAPHPTVSPEVLGFAREQGVEHQLSEFIELTRQVYPSATQFEVLVEDDPEFPDRYLVFEVVVPLTVEQAREADKRWHQGWLRINQYPRVALFRKSVNLP
jgi:hypothetical protein